ncbi:hypothetical protein LEP1GSC169_2750 [Leptospira santarosai str. HAI1349]|nr:hypothetical protein LEP1GSC169_2750 [Leptospira santarosai str. HAI1349]
MNFFPDSKIKILFLKCILCPLKIGSICSFIPIYDVRVSGSWSSHIFIFMEK